MAHYTLPSSDPLLPSMYSVLPSNGPLYLLSCPPLHVRYQVEAYCMLLRGNSLYVTEWHPTVCYRMAVHYMLPTSGYALYGTKT